MDITQLVVNGFVYGTSLGIIMDLEMKVSRKVGISVAMALTIAGMVWCTACGSYSWTWGT